MCKACQALTCHPEQRTPISLRMSFWQWLTPLSSILPQDLSTDSCLSPQWSLRFHRLHQLSSPLSIPFHHPDGTCPLMIPMNLMTWTWHLSSQSLECTIQIQVIMFKELNPWLQILQVLLGNTTNQKYVMGSCVRHRPWPWHKRGWMTSLSCWEGRRKAKEVVIIHQTLTCLSKCVWMEWKLYYCSTQIPSQLLMDPGEPHLCRQLSELDKDGTVHACFANLPALTWMIANSSYQSIW